jgi:hypothetical protein
MRDAANPLSIREVPARSSGKRFFGEPAVCPNAVQPERSNRQHPLIRAGGRRWQGRPPPVRALRHRRGARGEVKFGLTAQSKKCPFYRDNFRFQLRAS